MSEGVPGQSESIEYAAADAPRGEHVSYSPSIEWFPLLLAADIAVLVIAYLATVVRTEAYTFDLLVPDWPRMAVWCVVLTLVWLPVAINTGAYGRFVIGHPLRGPYTIAKSTLIAGGLFHLIPLVGGPVYSRSASLTVVLALVVAMAAWRWLLPRFVAIQGPAPSDVIVVGAGWAARTFADAIRTHPSAGVRIRAFVDSDPARLGSDIYGVSIRPISELSLIVRQMRRAPRIVLAIPEEAHASVYEQLTSLAQVGVDVVSMASLYEDITGRIPVHHLGGYWWASLPRPSTDVLYLSVKRVVDICLSVAGLILLAILLPFIGPLLKLETRGSLFFTQDRVGRFGAPLRIAKLRTLRDTYDMSADHWLRKRSNSASPLGHLVRTLGLDELPQCWNVLRGQMSFIGPRPYVPEEVANYQHDIPFFRCRSLVKPGLTGWAQVNWGYGLSLADEIEKLQYDLYYVGHQSFYLDLLILLRTIGYALRRARPVVTREAAAIARGEPVVVAEPIETGALSSKAARVQE